jgi:aminoglycoside/choline kinase family phosphotransferase
MGRHEKSTLSPLAPSGSDRQYVQISFPDSDLPTLMAFFNPCVEENLAQMEFTHHFKQLGFRVPEILAYNPDKTVFIVEHLGTLTLFNLVSMGINKEVVEYYKWALADLVRLQTQGIKKLNMDLAYPAAVFDRQSILWDLNYFKYCFLKPARIAFNESQLEKDFQQFADQLELSEPKFFCYRDFQSRNIMIHQDQPWYIDFQGGRRGPLPYDVVSLLHQVKANLPESDKEELFRFYLQELKKVAPLEVPRVEQHYNHFVYFRLLQVLGAYGFRGLVERKAHFLQSIPFAAQALENRLQKHPIGLHLPELDQILQQIIHHYSSEKSDKFDGLTVSVSSFSFKKKGTPTDLTGNGGGYVFDCRGLPNPHRLPHLRDLTGQDQPIADFMMDQPETEVFLKNAFSLVDLSVENYLNRKFQHLQVNFGCTGGRHRSVFCTEQMKNHLAKKYPQIAVLVNHLEIINQNED